jgi:exodeoxyribonuclease VII small subunit
MSKPIKTNPPKDFETALSELEALIATLEAGDLPLDASLTAYKRGVELTRYCQHFLTQAEQQLAVLEGDTLQALTLDTPRDD